MRISINICGILFLSIAYDCKPHGFISLTSLHAILNSSLYFINENDLKIMVLLFLQFSHYFQ